MIFRILIFYILGYLNIEVEGVFVERFINICKSKGILLWNVKMKKGVLLYANIGIKDYKNIRTIAKKTGTRVRIKKKCGIPFVLNRYKIIRTATTLLKTPIRWGWVNSKLVITIAPQTPSNIIGTSSKNIVFGVILK